MVFNMVGLLLSGNFIAGIQRFRCNVDSNREKFPKGNSVTLTSKVELLIDVSVVNPDNFSNESVGSVLNFHRSKYPKKLIIGHINIKVLCRLQIEKI